MRADKFLWSVRLFKTRADAADACKDNKILIRNNALKAGYDIKVNDEILVKHGSMRNFFLVKDLPKSRVSAKLVSEYLTEITSAEDQERNKLIADAKKESNYVGSGRPTKRDRRSLDKWTSGLHGLKPPKKTKKKK
jgi:ribosome-associated heat shock protein Hsp15